MVFFPSPYPPPISTTQLPFEYLTKMFPTFLLSLLSLILNVVTSRTECPNTDGTSPNVKGCACTKDELCRSNYLCRSKETSSTSTLPFCASPSHPTLYVETSEGQCDSKSLIRTIGECQKIGKERYHDRSATIVNTKHKPRGCYYAKRALYMNQHPTTNASCTADTKCVCRMECPPGTHQQWRTSDKGTSTPSSCTPCPVAHYQDEAGKSFCKFCRSPCLPGTYTDSTGAKICACKECPGGKYMDEFGQRGCKNCVPGRYHPLSRQTTLKACNNCSTGSYTDRPGMIKCVKCPIDTDTDTMSLLQRGASSLGDCKQCADNKTTGLPRFSSVRSVEEIPLEMSFRFRCSATPEWLCNRTMEDFKNHSSSLSSLSSSSSSGGCYKSHYGTCERKMCKNKDEYHPDADRMHLLRYVGFPADACHVAPVPINPAMTNYTCKSCRGEHCEYGTCTSEGYKVKTGCKECQQGWYKYDFNTWSDCTKCDANNPNQGIIEDIVILLFATYLLLSTLYVLLRTEAEDYVEKREQMQSSSSSSSSSSKRSKLSSSKDYKKTPLVAVLPLLHQIQMTSVLIVVVQPPLSLWTTTVQFLLKVLTLDLTSFLPASSAHCGCVK